MAIRWWEKSENKSIGYYWDPKFLGLGARPRAKLWLTLDWKKCIKLHRIYTILHIKAKKTTKTTSTANTPFWHWPNLLIPKPRIRSSRSKKTSHDCLAILVTPNTLVKSRCREIWKGARRSRKSPQKNHTKTYILALKPDDALTDEVYPLWVNGTFPVTGTPCENTIWDTDSMLNIFKDILLFQNHTELGPTQMSAVSNDGAIWPHQGVLRSKYI